MTLSLTPWGCALAEAWMKISMNESSTVQIGPLSEKACTFGKVSVTGVPLGYQRRWAGAAEVSRTRLELPGTTRYTLHTRTTYVHSYQGDTYQPRPKNMLHMYVSTLPDPDQVLFGAPQPCVCQAVKQLALVLIVQSIRAKRFHCSSKVKCADLEKTSTF